MTIKEILKEIEMVGHKSKLVECCGLVGYKNGSFVLKNLENKASDPSSFFLISPIDYLKFKKEYELVCIYHTHAVGEENPSAFDIKMSNSSCAPFLIYGVKTNKFSFYLPKFYDVEEDRIKDLQCAI